MRWITEEEYHALNNGMSKDKITSGTNVTESTSGQVLESKAGPHTLEQKDYQGNAIVHDIMTKEGLNEMETSNKTTTYGAVNSTITERAPNINKTFQQNQSYSESYQTKTENIQAQNYERNIETPQFTRTQNNLNLNVPNNLNVNASESITRNIGTRNMSVGTQEMWGQTYNFNGGTIQRFGDVTIIRGDYVQFRANSFILGPGSSDAAPTPVKPRRAPADVIAKVSGTFASKSIELPPAYDVDYIVQVVFTLTGEYEMESVHSVNPLTLNKEGLQAQVAKTLGDFFYGMQLTQMHDKGVDQGVIPSFIIGNRFGDYTLTNGTSVANPYPGCVVVNYSLSISKEKEFVKNWILNLTGTLDAKVTIAKRTTFDNIEIQANNMIQKAQSFLHNHENDPHYGPIIRALRTYTRPVINSMYQDAEFLDNIVIKDAVFIEP